MSRPFANLDGLVRLSHKEGVDIRRPLLRVLTDLYVQETSHTREEEQQYVELALRLLPDVDAATRAAVARKLAAYPHAPRAIIEVLAPGMPEMAALLERIKLNPGVRAAALSAPPAPEPAAASPSASSDLPHAGSAPAEEPAIAASLGEAFLRMLPKERAALLEGLDPQHLSASLDSLGLPMRPGARGRLEKAALQRNRNDFARELQLSLGISPRVAWRIAQDDSGELIVTAAKALDMRSDAITRILLILNPMIGESVERVFSLMRLFETLPAEAVVPIVASWREETMQRSAPGRFQPVLAEDTPAATAGARAAPRPLDEPAARPAAVSYPFAAGGQGGAKP